MFYPSKSKFYLKHYININININICIPNSPLERNFGRIYLDITVKITDR